MFTGIIEAIGHIADIQQRGGDLRIQIQVGALDMSDVTLGDSIATSGVCLTVIDFDQHQFSADVSNETLSLTTVSGWRIGSRVNLEKALTPQTRLGGHWVAGHVDGIGRVVERHDDGRSVRFRIQAPNELAKYIAHKGSITVDGTSLTVNAVNGAQFELNIVPHTLEKTLIGDYQNGSQVNLEVDILARHLERLLLGDAAADNTTDGGNIDSQLLARHGYRSPQP